MNATTIIKNPLEPTITNEIGDAIINFISDCINDNPELTDHQIRAILLRVKKETGRSQLSDWR